jgi:DNA-binding GntR family transcriptional regulator
VTELSFEDMEEIYAARSGLEGLAARRGAEAMGDADVERMQGVFKTIAALGEAQAIDAYIATRWEFHAICYRAARRARLLREVERLFLRAERYNRLVLSTPERFRESVERHHRNLLEACTERDGDAAEEAIRIGMQWCVECLTPVLTTTEPA